MIRQRRWPNPADSALDRARSIAREYRDALHAADPGRCAILDRAAEEFGELWLVARPQFTDSELVTLTDLAETLGVARGTVWAWWSRGHIPREPNGLFFVDAVVDALAARRVNRKPAAPDVPAPVVSEPDDAPDARCAGDGYFDC